MKKLLPKFVKNPQGFTQHRNGAGFTLVELLVVISIMAILAVVGYAVFSSLGAQAKARNNTRRQDIRAIANALEVNRSSVTADTYALLAANQFSNNKIPTDPGSPTSNYCANTAVDTQPADITAATCAAPAGYSVIGAGPLAGKKWKMCAWLEAETSPTKAAQAFCMLSAQ